MRATIAITVLTGIAVFAARAAEAPTEPAATATETRAVMTGDQVVQILDYIGVDYKSVNVLAD